MPYYRPILGQSRAAFSCGDPLLVPTGVHHGRSGDRLVAEIYTRTPHHFVSSGVRRVENGLSYPTLGAPPQRYIDALETAMHQRRGIFRHDVELANHPLLKPWSLKAAFDGGEPLVRVPGCTITNVDNVLNEANILWYCQVWSRGQGQDCSFVSCGDPFMSVPGCTVRNSSSMTNCRKKSTS